jgi:glycerol-3-phosphate acyltransferase PlsY
LAKPDTTSGELCVLSTDVENTDTFSKRNSVMSAIAPGMILLAYLCGSISSAILVCRIAGLPDPRVSGSGNPGATNVLRIGGKGAAVAVLIFDVLKGMLPVWGAYAGHHPFWLGLIIRRLCWAISGPYSSVLKAAKALQPPLVLLRLSAGI